MKLKITTFSLLICLFIVTLTVGSFLIFYSFKKHEIENNISNSILHHAEDIKLSITDSVLNNRGFLDKEKLQIIFEQRLEHMEYITGIMLVSSNGSRRLPLTAAMTHIKQDSLDYIDIEVDDIFSKTYFLFDNPYVGLKLPYNDPNKEKIYIVFKLDIMKIEKILTSIRTEYIWMMIIFPLLLISLFYHIMYECFLTPIKEIELYVSDQKNKLRDYNIIELNNLKDSVISAIHRLEMEKVDLHNISMVDVLSGISNRKGMEEYLTNKINISSEKNSTFALIFMDLDNFKMINDSLGHDVGDRLLKDVADRLRHTIKSDDFIARIGGDEFIIVLSTHSHKIGLINSIEQIESAIKTNAYILGSKKINVSASYGVAMYPQDGETPIDLMKHADIALYDAKKKGKNCYKFFTESLDEELKEYVELNSSMKSALASGQYEMYYQPQIDTETFDIVGAEALIRWNHPEKGFIAPNKFIPIAEQNGFINELGSWIIEDIIRQKKIWEKKGIDISISANVSATQILTSDFVEFLSQLLDYYQINRSNLCIEITEYIFIEATTDVLNLFNNIKKLGVKMHLDDFGTGYSSLSFLKKFPIDVVKIDKAFIEDYNTIDGRIFFETIVNMCNTLGLSLIAEGVETWDQLAFLKTFNRHIFQGYLSSPAISVDEFEIFYNSVM